MIESEPIDAEGDGGDAAEDAPAAASSTARGTRPAATRSTPSAPARPSIFGAARSSIRPLDIRGDLRALPSLVRHWSFLVPLGLTFLSVALVPLTNASSLSIIVYQYFAARVPFIPVFIAGFFAARGSYLLGILIALASAAIQAVAFGVGGFDALFASAIDPTTNQAFPRDQLMSSILVDSLITGVPYSALFAAAAAWYRRFLRSAGPRSQARPTGGRRPDGKVAKRNEGRPILARRR
jgi:hypothetical protein